MLGAEISGLSVVGLGKLGSPLLACLARRGYNVIGYDINESFVSSIKAGKAPVVEPRLQDLITESRSRISATMDLKEMVTKSEVTFCIVPTPSETTGKFSNEFVKTAFQALGEAYRGSNKWHLFVVTSTVLPGSMDSEIVPVLEKASGKKVGKDFGVCYSPLFIALGSVVNNILMPDFTLIGESDERAGATLETIYKKMVENDSRSWRMNFVNAELTKISVNAYVTMKISFANQLAEMCEKLPNADVDVVTTAVGADTRVGKKYLKGAMGFGGPCFPRDNNAVAYIARTLGTPAFLAESTDKVNHRQVDRVVDLVLKEGVAGKQVALIGLAYKPDTPVVEESQGLMIAQKLVAKGAKLKVFDPLAMESSRSLLGDRVHWGTSTQDCVSEADIVVVTLPGEPYKVNPLDLKKGKPFVLDCWGTHDARQFNEVSKYRKLGLGEVRHN